eukprot:scaffold118665_cov30-Tisochrysis_lutea.AAC.4
MRASANAKARCPDDSLGSPRPAPSADETRGVAESGAWPALRRPAGGSDAARSSSRSSFENLGLPNSRTR